MVTVPDLQKIKPVNNFSMKGGGVHEAPPLADELLATDSCQEKESHFPMGLCPLVGPQCPSV